MSTWRSAILSEFVPNVSKLTLVADPDGLLSEERLVMELRGRGFALIEFEDAIEFRYAYESNYRSIWDRGEQTDLVVILRLQDTELDALPYDLLQAGRKLSFNLGDLFPNLSYPVVEQLDRALLDALFDAQRKAAPDRMGENATIDFVLRHVFGIAAELITHNVELLRALLRLHYSTVALPDLLAKRLIHVLSDQPNFKNWPLDLIVADATAFYAFLQERWSLFLLSFGQGDEVNEKSAERGLAYSGPEHLPFDHQDIRVYIDNLFLEGKLTPVEADGVSVAADSWVRTGILNKSLNDNSVRVARLFDLVESSLPKPDSRHADWIAFALKWAELASLVLLDSGSLEKSRLAEIGQTANAIFADWLSGHYASLINQPPNNPAMVHHVPRRIARELEEKRAKRVALIVMDGLALDQWVTLRSNLESCRTDLLFRESATFAWVPTITCISRQAIFAGKAPLYFPSTIHTTNSEEKHWKQFWESYGLSRLEVAYQRGLGDGDPEQILETIIHPSKTRVVGLVVDKVDKIMHGMQLGTPGMHNQVSQWSQDGYLRNLLTGLFNRGFSVWLTADHGNIECSGLGNPTEGVIAETRGQRARIYPSPELRNQVATTHPFGHVWESNGLPPDCFPLLASGSDAFLEPGKSIVGHGGISLQEILVPFVKLERKTN